MLFLAVLMKLSWSMTRQLQLGAEVVFQIFAKAGTYPLLFMAGVRPAHSPHLTSRPRERPWAAQ